MRALMALCLMACGAARPAGPQDAIAQYAGALSRSDSDASWAMLDPDARQGRTLEEHTALLRENQQELTAVGAALDQAGPRARARAIVALSSGERVVLVLEDGGWRVDGGVLDAVGLNTPLDAIGALRRALMRRDLPSLETVLSRQTRAEWEDEIRRVVESTSDPADFEVEVDGNRAIVHAGGGVIELVRESGGWHVVDVRPP